MVELIDYLKSFPFLALPLLLNDIIAIFFIFKVLTGHVKMKRLLPASFILLGLLIVLQVFIQFKLRESCLLLTHRVLFFAAEGFLFIVALSLVVRLYAKNIPLYKTMVLAMLIMHISIVVEVVVSLAIVFLVLAMGHGDLIPFSSLWISLLIYLTNNVFLFALLFFMLRTRFLAGLNDILDNRSLSLKMFWLAAMIDLSFYFLLHHERGSNNWNMMLLVIVTAGFLLCLLLFVFYSRYLSKTLELEQSQLLLLQQQSYMKQLEKIQFELRGVQHDYKNLITGLYLHAKDGDTEKIQTYIEKSLLNLDEGIQEEMKWSSQLASISSPELKGLLLSKMILAKQHDILFNLEVAESVDEIKMSISDFLRCIGILLDNAVEAVEKEAVNRRIDILLIKEADKLTLVVKNPCTEKVNLAKIRNRGFSTKGPDRGLGLSIYQEIVQKYNNILSETKQQNGEFIQELAIFESV
ncbi:sensor histidine kinase [Enterococcus malodoratus]|uniref:sensor histidine kinase n=1 Tax=Enterococcus malodoratus TaxID=71451 RepID=UPI003FD3D953